MVRLAPKYLNGNYGLFELVAATFQMLLGEERQESAHPLIPKETRAREHAFQLPERGLGICTRGGHVREYLLFSSMCKCIKHALSLSGLASFVVKGALWVPEIGSQKNIRKQEGKNENNQMHRNLRDCGCAVWGRLGAGP